MLDKNLFKSLYSREVNSQIYSVIQPLNNPLILFSKLDGSPLFSMHFKSQNCDNGSLITKRIGDKDIQFQGIINKDNQEIEFVVCNLTKHYLNFYLMKEDGTNLNKINVLRPYEVLSIKSDSANDCLLILNSIKDSPSSSKLTVEQSEKSSKKEDKGTYYYLSVIPENKSEIYDKFKETIWSCVDLFYFVEDKPKNNSPTYFFESAPSRMNRVASFDTDDDGESLDFDLGSDMDDECCQNDFMQQEFSTSNKKRRGVVKQNIGNSFFEAAADAYKSLTNSLFSFGSTDMGLDRPKSKKKSKPCNINLKNPQLDFLGSNKSCMFPSKEVLNYAMPFPDSMTQKAKSDFEDTIPLDDNLIQKSFIGKVSHGKKIDVKTTETNIDFNYDKTSEICKLGLSIDEALKFNTLDENLLMEKAKNMLDEIVRNEYKNFIDRLDKVYTSDKCVICFDDDTKNNMVIYQCGHNCCHYQCGNNLTSCPLCRNLISAHILVDC